MSEEYPLYPLLSEDGIKEAQTLVDGFKQALIKAATEAISGLYCDITPHIESDSWSNYRNDLIDGLRNYNNRLVQGEYDFKQIRQQIYLEYRDDIIKDLNQDMLEEIESLKKQLEGERDFRR